MNHESDSSSDEESSHQIVIGKNVLLGQSSSHAHKVTSSSAAEQEVVPDIAQTPAISAVSVDNASTAHVLVAPTNSGASTSTAKSGKPKIEQKEKRTVRSYSLNHMKEAYALFDRLRVEEPDVTELEHRKRVGATLDVNMRTFTDWLKARPEMEAKMLVADEKEMRRLRGKQNSLLPFYHKEEIILRDILLDMRARDERYNCEWIRAKMLQLVEESGAKAANHRQKEFTASPRWLTRYLRRHNLTGKFNEGTLSEKRRLYRLQQEGVNPEEIVPLPVFQTVLQPLPVEVKQYQRKPRKPDVVLGPHNATTQKTMQSLPGMHGMDGMQGTDDNSDDGDSDMETLLQIIPKHIALTKSATASVTNPTVTSSTSVVAAGGGSGGDAGGDAVAASESAPVAMTATAADATVNATAAATTGDSAAAVAAVVSKKRGRPPQKATMTTDSVVPAAAAAVDSTTASAVPSTAVVEVPNNTRVKKAKHNATVPTTAEGVVL